NFRRFGFSSELRNKATSTKYVRVRRLFTCANDTKKDFQAVIKLPQRFGEKIDGVKVLPN
ncbi:hypothetical protein, partial [Vibrio parahaemolyticus]